MSIQQEKFKEIADAIRAKTGETAPIKPSAFANKIPNVYNRGYIDGRNTMISRTLTSIDDEALTTVGNYAFAGMAITSVNLPNVYRVGKYGFRGCTSLTEIDLPKLTRLSGNGTYTFGYCEKVTRYNLPKLKTDSTQSTYAELVQTFEGNCALERLELKNDITISTLCFYKCSKLKTLVLGANASLKSTDAFNSTPIKNGTGYIYVPDDKVNAYKTATNWVRFASQIKGYSELPEE